MAAACDFDAIPRSITSGGSVRFFPRVSGFTKPIVAWSWHFGDTTSGGVATPTHAYPAVTVPTLYDVTLTVYDANYDTATITKTAFIRSDAVGNVPALPSDGTFHQVSVLIYDDANSMIVNRNPWTGCHLYLMTPKTVDSIDKIGTATFSLLDVGDSTATERGLMVEGKNIVFITGKTITFSGKIRRCTQNTQNGFNTTTRVKLWDIECDSDLAKLQKVNIDSTVLATSGALIYDTPGNIARLILTPTSPARDTRGIINCVDPKVSYQLNSSTVAEQAGSQYEHLMALHALTNYDLRARADFLAFPYTAFGRSSTTQMVQHVAKDQADPQYILLDNSVAYRYYAIKIADLWDSSNPGIGFRRVEFQSGTGTFTSQYPPAQSDTYVKATTKFSTDTWPYYATDPTKSLVGVYTGNAWIADATTGSTNQRFHVDLGSAKTITRLYYENYHNLGTSTSIKRDAKNVTIWGSNTGAAFADLTYANDANWTQIQPTNSAILTTGATFTADEFVGAYAVLVGRDVPASKAFTTNYAVNNDRLLITTASTFFAVNDRVSLSTSGALPTNLSATTYYVTAVTSTYLTLSTTLGGSSVTVSSNGTGTHAIILVAETAGVKTFGKITTNTATTISCADMMNQSVAPQSLGYFLIYRGYLIDFAQDLSQPSVIKNLDINKDVFDFSDNDDKRKLSTKIVATGKDLQGVTISVAISAVHEYDESVQFFKDSTHITLASEGYIARNTYSTGASPVTIAPGFTGTSTSFVRGTTTTELILAPGRLIPVGALVRFSSTATLPAPLVSGAAYYCVEQNDTVYLCVSTSIGGAKITLTDAGTGTHYITFDGLFHADRLTFVAGDLISFSGTTAPTGYTFGNTYTCFSYTIPGTDGGGWFSTGATLVNDGSNIWVHPLKSVVNINAYTGAYSGLVCLWLYGWGYVIPSGTVMAIVWGSSYKTVTVSAATSEITDTDGTLLTIVPVGVNMFHGDEDFSGKAYLMSPRLYVEDATIVDTNEVLIGEEKVTVTAIGNDTTYGSYIDVGAASGRITSATKKCYPHGVGALVARTNYTEASPQANSAVQTYGVYIDMRTVDNNITYGTLDAYVTGLILGLGIFYKKANTWGPMALAYVPHVGEYYGALAQTSLQVPPRSSDRLSFTEYTGATPVEYQIVSVTIDHDEMTVTLELGDFEKNVFTSLQQSTNAINRTLT